MTEKNELIINEEYLRILHRLPANKRQEKIIDDITDHFGGVIDLQPPLGTPLMPLYNDIRDYVIAKDNRGSYDIVVHTSNDKEIVSGLSLGYLKEIKDGVFRFLKKRQP